MQSLGMGKVIYGCHEDSGHCLLIFRDQEHQISRNMQDSLDHKILSHPNANSVPTEEHLLKHCPFLELPPKKEAGEGRFLAREES